MLPLPPAVLESFMREALAEAEAAGLAGELPIGAIVVIAGEVISRGRSRQRERRTQLAHAELEALLGGGEPLLARHDEAVLFTTVEPCPLCLGAAVMADVPHIVFALADATAGVPEAVESVPYVRRHIESYSGGLLASESRALIARYQPGLLRYVDPDEPTPGATLTG